MKQTGADTGKSLYKKSIKELLNSDKSALIFQGVNHYIKTYGIESAIKSREIKKTINNLLKSNDLQDKSRGIKLYERLYTVENQEKLFSKTPVYKIIMDNAGLLTAFQI